MSAIFFKIMDKESEITQYKKTADETTGEFSRKMSTQMRGRKDYDVKLWIAFCNRLEIHNCDPHDSKDVLRSKVEKFMRFMNYVPSERENKYFLNYRQADII